MQSTETKQKRDLSEYHPEHHLEKEDCEGHKKVDTGRKKRSRISCIFDLVIAFVFLAGVCVIAYPTVSNWINEWRMSRAVKDYDRLLGQYGAEDYTAAFEKAREYNRCLKENSARWSEKNRTPGYEEALRVDESGIMGYVTIEKIRVRLPFYHGTEESVLQTAIGHIEGTSLPIGDPGDHAVLSAHRGLPSAKLFTDLPKLEIGDTFEVAVLDRHFTYRVDRILTVLPDSAEAMEALEMEEGQDYVTLMTCTPYGINTHRLLVRGKRIAEEPK